MYICLVYNVINDRACGCGASLMTGNTILYVVRSDIKVLSTSNECNVIETEDILINYNCYYRNCKI